MLQSWLPAAWVNLLHQLQCNLPGSLLLLKLFSAAAGVAAAAVAQMAVGDPPRYNCLSNKYAAAAGDKFGWQNGLDSRCIPVTWLFNTFTYQFPDSANKAGWKDSMCYKSSCTAAGELQLDILGSKVSCPSGQLVDLGKALPQQFQSGTIGPCPDNAAVCKTLSCNDSCAVGGTCVSGKCYCNLMYMGPDCAKKLTPDGNYTNYVPVVDDGKAGGASQTYDAGYLMVGGGSGGGGGLWSDGTVWTGCSTACSTGCGTVRNCTVLFVEV
jgi:hypothetical protein